MPHLPIEPSDMAQYDRGHAVQYLLPAGKRASINISFSNPLHENAATVFDTSNGVGIAHRNNQHATPPFDVYGPFSTDRMLLIVGSHKDGTGGAHLPWHQSWIRIYREEAAEIRVGTSDAGVPQGGFSNAHAQIVVEIIQSICRHVECGEKTGSVLAYVEIDPVHGGMNRTPNWGSE